MKLTAWVRSLYYRIFQNPLIRRIVKNSGYLVSAVGISSGMGMLQGIFVTRMLGPANYGVLGAITTFTSAVNRFASFRMNEMVVRYVSHYQEKEDHQRAAAVFKLASFMEMVGSLVAFILVWFLAPLGARYFVHDDSLASWFQVYGIVILVNLVYESATGLLQIFDRFALIAIITAAQSALSLSLIAIAYFNDAGLAAVVLAYMIGKFVGALSITIAAFWQARRAWGSVWWRAPLSLLQSERRSLLTFAFSTNISSTVSLVAKDSDVLWVSAFLGTTQAGYYKLALQLANILQLPVSPLPKATFPELAREIARRQWTNVQYILRQGSLLSASYSIPTTALLIIIGKWLIDSLYGPEFLPSYPALVIILLGYTFVNIFYWNRVTLLSLARPVFPTIVNFSGMVLKVSAILLLVPPYGYLFFAALLSGYYIYTVGLAVARVYIDIRARTIAPVLK